MTMKNGACAPTGSACPKKATELFYVSHPQATRAFADVREVAHG